MPSSVNVKNHKYFLLIFVVILLLMSVPKSYSVSLRGATASLLSPIWSLLSSIKSSTLSFLGQDSTEELQQIQLENYLLRREIEYFQEMEQLNPHMSTWNAIPARVIYRSPDCWNSSLWIDIGQEDNDRFAQRVIAKNSPVLVGTAVVGTVDYVGKHQSRVRLITDSGLTPSVRVARGQAQRNVMLDHVNDLLQWLNYQPDTHFQDKRSLTSSLEQLKNNLALQMPTWLLAKGELNGNGKPLWRSLGHVLKGTGFNYDFSDEEGPARDLRSGEPFEGINKNKAIPLIKVHDLLVTTGMDGVFPKGLRVAEVTKISPLKEGDYYYEIEAKPIAGNLDDLSLVYVLPPLGYEEEDQPPLFGR